MTERQDSDREVLTSLPRSRPVRRSAKRGDRAAPKSAGAATQPRRAPATKPRTATATAAATAKRKPHPKAATKTAAGPSAAPRTAPTRKVPPAGYAAPTGRSEDGVAAGTADVLSTTIQAAAELAQIGLTVGRQTLQSMFDRLPRP